MKEVDAVRERYARRSSIDDPLRYSLLNESVLMSHQEKQRALVRWVQKCAIQPLVSKRVLEVGCGSGSNLLELMRLGFAPENLVGNELLPRRSEEARRMLPGAVTVLEGDATQMNLAPGSFDVVMQSTVFSSLLDDAFQTMLAERMWKWVKPGGGVLWYDFVYDNPANPDVRGVPLERVCKLFPAARIWTQRLTLAPPIARRVSAIHPRLYGLFNLMPHLRTHVLCWIQKP
ncbi:MAG: class I SAM-dependent methyltransferase [Burkholderiales bacterium]